MKVNPSLNKNDLVEMARLNVNEIGNVPFPSNKFNIKIWSKDHNPPNFHIMANGWDVSFLIESGEEYRVNNVGKETQTYSYIVKNIKSWLDMQCKILPQVTNRKNDMANKLCWMLSGYQVIMQDEQLRAWKIKHGKKVQHSILGRVKTKLMSKEDTVVLNRFVPTTKLCRDCGFKNDSITVRDREFVCPNCGVVYDRDIHAAENMIWLYENIIGVERTEFKRADFDEQIRLFFDKMKHEAADTSVQR